MTEANEVEKWLSTLPVLAQLQDSKQTEAVKALAGTAGMAGFLGLLLGSRQAFYAQLAAIPLGNSADAARASVIQGKIQGIDLVRDTLLELFLPTEQGA